MSVARLTRAALRRTLFASGLAAAVATAACSGEVISDKESSGPGAADPSTAIGVNHFVRSPNRIPGQYIVVMNDAVTFASGNDVRALSISLASGYRAQVLETYQHAIRGFSAKMSEEDARALAEDPMVAYVEEDGIVSADFTQNTNPGGAQNRILGLDRVDQRDLPLDNKYTANVDGTGVTAYVIDTGIRVTHQEFGGRASVLLVDNKPFDAFNDGQNGIDCNGHGTHVAGTIGGKTFGLAKNVTLKAVRVLNCQGSGASSGVVRGIEAVAKDHALHPGPAVANMSLGGGKSTAIDNAVRAAIDSGVVFAVAAGNEGKPGTPANACNGSPAGVREALTVGAANPATDNISGFSDTGNCVDIFAPGENILSSFATNDTATAILAGTSMATPHVAGVAALFLSANPNAKPADVANALVSNATPNKVKGNLFDAPNVLLFSGFIGNAAPPTNPTPPPPPPPANGGQVKVAFDQGSLGEKQSDIYRIDNVVAGSSLTVQVEGAGFGDIDLFVGVGGVPDQGTFTCRSISDGGSESCTVKIPAGADRSVFIRVFAFHADDYVVRFDFTQR